MQASHPIMARINHRGVGRGWSVSHVCLSVCFFRALKGKRLELSTPNLVHMYCSIAVARRALNQGSKGQGYTITKTVTVAIETRAATAGSTNCPLIQLIASVNYCARTRAHQKMR